MSECKWSVRFFRYLEFLNLDCGDTLISYWYHRLPKVWKPSCVEIQIYSLAVVTLVKSSRASTSKLRNLFSYQCQTSWRCRISSGTRWSPSRTSRRWGPACPAPPPCRWTSWGGSELSAAWARTAAPAPHQQYHYKKYFENILYMIMNMKIFYII